MTLHNVHKDYISKSKLIAVLVLYLIAMGIAEAVVTYHSVETGLIIHAFILVVTVILTSYFREEKSSRFFQALILAPMIRILSLSVPLLTFLNPIYNLLLIYTPLLLTALLITRSQKITAASAGITGVKLKLQMIIMLSGLIFGVTEYFILESYISPIKAIHFGNILSQVIIMLFFVGFTEELIFRGMILANSARIFSATESTIFVSVLFMLLHTGWKSLPDLFFVFLVSVFYCWAFLKTRSIVGISLSHGITNTIEFIIIPLIYGNLTLLSFFIFKGI